MSFVMFDYIEPRQAASVVGITTKGKLEVREAATQPTRVPAQVARGEWAAPGWPQKLSSDTHVQARKAGPPSPALIAHDRREHVEQLDKY